MREILRATFGFRLLALGLLSLFTSLAYSIHVPRAFAKSDLTYSTFFGGDSADGVNDVVRDADGHLYVTGLTCSQDFPTTPGAFDRTVNGCDAFVAKFDASNALLFSTVIGGTEENGGDGFGEYASAIALDAEGNAYITGGTNASDFPTTANAFDTSFGGWGDAFVAKFDAQGKLLYSTFVGGAQADGSEWANAIAVNAKGEAYVTGRTSSADFPTTATGYDREYGGGWSGDAFLAKLDASGSQLLYGSFFGDVSTDEGTALALDANRNVYVAGTTFSESFPTTPNAFQQKFHKHKCGAERCSEIFVLKLNATDDSLAYSTLIGGGRNDSSSAMAVDGNGKVYVTGETRSKNFPVSVGAYDTTYNGEGYFGEDAFILKLNADGSALEYSTFLGGKSYEAGSALMVDARGSVYVAGYTTSENFPTTRGAFDRKCNSGCAWLVDGFFVKLNPRGTRLRYATFVGGGGYDGTMASKGDGGHDSVSGVAIGENGIVYLGGGTKSPDFPTTRNAFDKHFDGYQDGFLMQLAVKPRK